MNATDNTSPVPPSGAFPLPAALAAEEAEQQRSAAHLGADAGRPPVSKGWILLLAVGLFGAYLAFVTPIAISLAIQVKALAPDHEEYLGWVLGAGSLAALIVGPLGGQLSDRTRSRLGRRRPWLIGGTLLGSLGLVIMAIAPNVWVLGAGWVVAQIGWSQTVNTFTTFQADRLPENQRGRVGAITGFATMVAPVVGATIGGSVAGNPFPLFLVPGGIAIVLVSLFVLRVHDDDSRELTFDSPLTAKVIASKYVFNPRQYPDFSWNWLGRFMFFFGLTLNTTFTAFFFSSRLDVPVNEIGGTVATVGLVGIIGTIGGVFGGGFLSDKLMRRRVFVLTAGVLFAIGSLILVTAPSLGVMLVGSFISNVAIGIFSAVDQALFLDVLPERDTEAGRFINITQFATTIPQATAPVVASLLLTIGAGAAGDKNYSLIYVAAAAFTLLGGLIVLKVKSVR